MPSASRRATFQGDVPLRAQDDEDDFDEDEEDDFDEDEDPETNDRDEEPETWQVNRVHLRGRNA
jgi:hypothetical protein